MAAVAGHIVCRLCQAAIPVHFKRAPDATGRHLLLLVVDNTPLHAHMEECGSSPDELVAAPPSLSPTVLAGRIWQMLDGQHYVSPMGSRACNMCGTKGPECVKGLRADRIPCCAACGVGNTHPAPQETRACGEWAQEHGAKG